ncbi:coiled-coil domain-containing protein 159 isoform X2 [Hemicordylus capensis]|uniref:coiled-coil domain-containing protein 159 isoform X2 n=1 Tax=Hemicordylus capensis TaxID=884348 RepID=UPI002302B2AB|nr:coiled-coil domain-containing protein 159 isoform X2 [Hemicordylus capensis]
MDALKEGMIILAAKGTTGMITAKDEKSRATSPNWFLSRAGSNASAQTQLEMAIAKPPGLIPETQVILKNELEFIKAQLQAQTKAFQALSHSITLLEQESNQQQGRIKQLEEKVQFASRLAHGEMLEGLMQKKIQEVWRAMTKEVEGLQGSMIQKESSMENLSQEVLESKKFLWEELEAVQGELRRIHQKLNQEVDITRNLVSIRKMQDNQMKCTKFLAQLKGRVPGSTSESVDNKPMTEELNDIWSAVNTLRNSITTCNIWSDKRKAPRMKGHMSRHHRKPSSAGSFFSDSALNQHRSSSEHSS